MAQGQASRAEAVPAVRTWVTAGTVLTLVAWVAWVLAGADEGKRHSSAPFAALFQSSSMVGTVGGNLSQSEASPSSRGNAWAESEPGGATSRPPAPPVLYWKLRKVAGSSVCLVLDAYARQNGLRIAAPSAELLEGRTRPPRKRDDPLKHKPQTKTKTSRRKLMEYSHLGDCAETFNPESVDVLCCHNHGQRTKRLETFRAKPGLVQIVTFREPISQMVSLYHYTRLQGGKNQTILPTLNDLKRFTRNHHNDYMREWVEGAWSVEEGPHDAKGAVEHLQYPKQVNLLVTIFERMDESLILLLDKLNLPLEDGLVTSKYYKHPSKDDWPQECVEHLEHIAHIHRYPAVYKRACEVFEQQVTEFGKEKLESRVAALRSLRSQQNISSHARL